MLSDGDCDRKHYVRDPRSRFFSNAERCLNGKLPPRVEALIRRKSSYDRNCLLRQRFILEPEIDFSGAIRGAFGICCKPLSLVSPMGGIDCQVRCSSIAPHATLGALFARCLHAFASSRGTLDVLSS